MDTRPPRAPNIRDVADRAGVSYQTVSRVLNGRTNIREETRARVLEAIDALNYRPNSAARALGASRSRTIGVLTSNQAHYGPATSLHAIEEAARAAGYRLSVTWTASGDAAAVDAALDHLMGQSIEALVVMAPQERTARAIEELAVPLPYVALATSSRASSRVVAVDQVAGGRLATRHLIDLGHEDILHLAGPQDWWEADARMRGYLDELGDASLRTRAPILGDWTAGFGFAAGRELLRLPDFTAVFAANDQMALGFLHACRVAGARVPEDVSVVGFDDIPESAHLLPSLTTIRQDFAAIGRRAVEVLVDEIERGHARSGPVHLAAELVHRDSSGPAPAGR